MDSQHCPRPVDPAGPNCPVFLTTATVVSAWICLSFIWIHIFFTCQKIVNVREAIHSGHGFFNTSYICTFSVYVTLSDMAILSLLRVISLKSFALSTHLNYLNEEQISISFCMKNKSAFKALTFRLITPWTPSNSSSCRTLTSWAWLHHHIRISHLTRYFYI